MTNEDEDKGLRLCLAIIREDIAQKRLTQEFAERLIDVADELLAENVALKARLDVMEER